MVGGQKDMRCECICGRKKEGSLQTMPQLCIGTVQGTTTNVRDNITNAIIAGYRHIDAAFQYAEQVPESDGLTYFDSLRDGIKEGLEKTGISREDIWITYKGDDLKQNKNRILEFVKSPYIKYIDLFLVHHSCGKKDDYDTLGELMELDGKLVKYWGVSNCENLKTLAKIRDIIPNHPLYANQIQAIPFGSSSRGRSPNVDLVVKTNELGIKVMLFAPVSGFTENDNNQIALFDPESGITIENIIKYYLIKYIIGTNNVLIVGSVSGGSIFPNIRLFQQIVTHKNIGDIDIIALEAQLNQYQYTSM